MKFAIITHAEHKINKQEIFAYEPYVKEMRLWLKYVDEVKIVAPVSKDKIRAIDSNYLIKGQIPNQVGNDEREQQHLNQVGNNEREQQHVNQVGNDESEQQHVNQIQHDNKQRHPQLDWGSHDSYQKGQIPKQVGNDEREQQRLNQVADNNIQVIKIPSIDSTSLKNGIKAVLKIPFICYQIYKAMQWADHIHLRCPGNIGLLGCFVQLLFPNKPKTVKYAGNWDAKSQQPWSYRLQKRIVSNTFLTRNCKVLVYGAWPNQSKNIVPFFTASYSNKEIEAVEIRDISIFKKHIPKQVGNGESIRHPQLNWGSYESERNDELLNQVQHGKAARHSALDAESVTPKLKFIYVGGLTPGKQPLLSVQVVHELKKKGYNVQLDMYGEGAERTKIGDYILDNSIEDSIFLHGNTTKEIVKKAYQQAHFLVFISKSEGWPKVVAEAMFWGCVPITSAVSCVPEMLGNGSRGTLVNDNSTEISKAIEHYINTPEKYNNHAQNAMEWSRQFTLEKFEAEIGKVIVNQVSTKVEGKRQC